MIRASLIIPVYNYANSFRCVLESIKFLDFSRDAFEVIIIDDFSDESVINIVDKYKHDFNIKYYRMNTNKGRAAARNKGIELAESELLIFNDGDRILQPDMIIQHLQLHSTKEKAVCIGNNIDLFLFDNKVIKDEKQLIEELFFKNGGKYGKCRFHYYYQELVGKIYDYRGQTDCDIAWISLLSGNFSIRKQCIMEVGGFDENFKRWGIENMELGYRLQKSGIKYYYNKKAVNYHIYHKQNRNAYELEDAIEYFYRKVRDERIKKYYDFLLGKINLGELTENYIDSKEYYNSKHLGTRYISTRKEAQDE